MTDASAAIPVAYGRYRITERIGAGAIGTVYQAHDPLIDRLVAIKIIRTETLAEDQRADYLERFRVEAQAGGRCLHPAIVAIHDAGEQDSAPYLVMEYVAGKPLSAVLAEPQARAQLDIPALMQDLLSALGYAHARGVIHRDIKPANIMVTPEGRAKIMDFGIARLERGELTMAGDMLGTPSYMAPEQVSGEAVDHRADLFSAAAVLHAMLTGRSPFAGRNMADTLLRLTSPAPADLAPLRAGQLIGFAPVLERGLAKSPAARFGSAAEFAAALRDVITEEQDYTKVIAPGHTKPVQAASRAGAALNEAVIAAAAARLARHVGPIARIHVDQAARQAMNEAEFIALLARHIPEQGEAARFLRDCGSKGAALSPALIQTGGTGGVLAAARGISPEALEAARAALAAYTGPIARLLIAQALAEAATLDALVERLAHSVQRPEDAEALRRKLRAILGCAETGH